MVLEMADLVTTVCTTPACQRIAWRRGLCGTCYRSAKHPGILVAGMAHGVDEEPPTLEWRPASGDDLRRLANLDRLLMHIESHNLSANSRAPAPLDLVAWYHRAGGELVWGRRPSGADLHAAVLDLEERFLRTPISMPREAILSG